jgi:hypothetical protein
VKNILEHDGMLALVAAIKINGTASKKRVSMKPPLPE